MCQEPYRKIIVKFLFLKEDKFGQYYIRSKVEPENLSEAFDKSLEKWEILKNGESLKFISDNYSGITTCGLCNLFYQIECEGCPIHLETRALCLGTPFTKISKKIECYGVAPFQETLLEEIKELCEEEYQFLKELKEKYCKSK